MSSSHNIGRLDGAMALHSAAVSLVGSVRRAELSLARVLGELERSGGFRRFASSIGDYAQMIGLGRGKGRQLCVIGRALPSLPELEAAMEEGRVAWTAAFEVARVAVPETEAGWVARAEDWSVVTLRAAVVAATKGDPAPEVDAAPDIGGRTLHIPLNAEDLQLVSKAMALLRARAGARQDGAGLSDSEVLVQMAEMVVSLEAPEQGVAAERFLTVIRECPSCSAVALAGGTEGTGAAVSECTVAMARCSGSRVRVGPDSVGRAHSTVSPRVRRLVFERDNYRCAATGCSNRLFLDVHHVMPRASGGSNALGNLVVLCGACHRRVHDGLLHVEIGAGGDFQFGWGAETAGMRWNGGGGGPAGGRCYPARVMLPIDGIRAEFELALAAGPVVVSSPTGSGKSTQVPRWCGELGSCLVVEPRRVACRSLAARVAELEGCALGERVGYVVRDDQRRGAGTRILFATPGVVLRWLRDGALPFDTVVLDELHERRLDVDLVLALLQSAGSPGTRLVVMSATLDGDRVAAHLGGRHVRAEGRTFPVEVRHGFNDGLLPSTQRLEDRVAAAVAASRSEPGDVLVFLPGKGEIAACEARLGGGSDRVLPLHGGLDLSEQGRVFDRTSARRVILATNVAETSLTIDGVGVVIDSGLVRQTRYHAGRGFLTLVPIARDSAEQRAGRAGRTARGIVYRLWDEAAILEPVTPPEVFRESLVPLVMASAACGRDPAALPFLDPPPPHALAAAVDELTALGALEGPDRLSERGRHMSDLPLDEHVARLLVEARDTPWLGAVIDLAAVLTVGRPLFVGGRSDDDEDNALRAQGCDALAAIRAVREGDPRRHGLSAFALREARQIARRLRAAWRCEPGPLPTSDDLVALCVAADPRTPHVRRQRKRHINWSNGGTEIELGRQSAIDPEAVEAIVVLDTRAIGLGHRDTRVIATCAIPTTPRRLASLGVGRDKLGTLRVESGRVIATQERVYARRTLVTREAEPTGALLREAAVQLTRDNRLLKGLWPRLGDRLTCALLYRGLLGAQLEREDAWWADSVWASVDEVPAPEQWLETALTDLDVNTMDELALLEPGDLLPPPLPDSIQELLDERYPRELTIGGDEYHISYAPLRRKVTLHHARGRSKTPPTPSWLPSWSGCSVEWVSRGKTRQIRGR